MQNVLLICPANKDRSKIAEDYFSEKYPRRNFESAGTNQKICNKLGTNFIDLEQLERIGSIYVMETKQGNFVNQFSENKFHYKIDVLRIKDYYKYYQKELIKILEDKLDFLLPKFS